MSSQNDSDTTFCSEVERNIGDKSNWVRRSQRFKKKPEIYGAYINLDEYYFAKELKKSVPLHSEDILKETEIQTSVEIPPHQTQFCTSYGIESSIPQPVVPPQQEPICDAATYIDQSHRENLGQKTISKPLDLCTKHATENEIQANSDVVKKINLEKEAVIQKDNLINLLQEAKQGKGKRGRKPKLCSNDPENPMKRAARPNSVGVLKRQRKSTNENGTRLVRRNKRNPYMSRKVHSAPVIRNPQNQSHHNMTTRASSIKCSGVSQLPDFYPPHFANQILPDCISNSQTITPPDNDFDIYPPTPDLTQKCGFDTVTSTPSMPDSLLGVFNTNNVREILKAGGTIYRLHEQHLLALAMILNLKVEYLRDTLEKILALDLNALQEIDIAYQKMMRDELSTEDRHDATSPLSEQSSYIAYSQSPKQHIFHSQTSNSCMMNHTV